MKFLKDAHLNVKHHFEKGGKLEFFYPLWEAQFTGLFTPGEVTRTASHVRDGLDNKRLMITVVIALLPCMLMAMYNTGYQALLAMAQGAVPIEGWRSALYQGVGLPFDFKSPIACVIYGALHYVPVVIASMATGGIVEPLVAMIRKHEINEGFLVTGMLIPLTLPPTIPLWMVVIGTIFGIVFAKEIFGGTGMNFLNPALTTRAFLFFAYPAAMSGDSTWIAADFSAVDSFSGATLLAQAAASGQAALAHASWTNAFLGFIPGSMGETSTLACLLGALLLVWTGIGSWRTMAGILFGTIAMAGFLNVAGSDTNPMFGVPWYWHAVMGGWAFGAVYMATDPVSSAFTNAGKLIYGAMIGILVVLIRVVNPAYPEGMMLAILFMNMFAPLIDHFFIQANIRRREARYAA
ncbi:MAG: NADH:ubiquinone reductase (Na(+)-transporting) subunit B [Spirochaetaceae bacterium]|nr:NADH:ubiquinone reductase (Na(+)-transporting) subunit B [Myxococcales bacterium]MCB9724935.1 NADH:ubiquinone reductase (Na(+)-transporting) subunit B [Spirochaetaceae bacterium]HPG25555.1 NADH:ubiquinone reductase (Na(+)-transporting) subunit B [Myxococcota bacterium]